MKPAWLALLAVACQGAEQGKATASGAAQGKAAPSASVAPAAPRAWYEGAWQGSYNARLLRIELPVGGVKEWKQDDGTKASGAGKLSLVAKVDGSITGAASGALGEHAVTGRVEGERVALSLTPTEPGGFRGVISGVRTPEGIKGTLNAATGDSLSVRQADVTLARASE